MESYSRGRRITSRMRETPPPVRGLDRTELLMFLFGILGFAVLMLAFGHDLAPDTYLPVVGLWVVGGVGFVWWFDRYLSRRSPPPTD